MRCVTKEQYFKSLQKVANRARKAGIRWSRTYSERRKANYRTKFYNVAKQDIEQFVLLLQSSGFWGVEVVKAESITSVIVRSGDIADRISSVQ